MNTLYFAIGDFFKLLYIFAPCLAFKYRFYSNPNYFSVRFHFICIQLHYKQMQAG